MQGHYEVVEKIAVGGMAEIFRGVARGAEGLARPVVIKKVRPRFSKDERFVHMLITEAKITSRLNHDNIVQILDLGQNDDGEHFIVMEYVEGHDLRAVFERSVETGVKIDTDLILFIMAEVCDALEHAHALEDGQGRPLFLVHRDVSPSNILLSYAGDVKLTDFGVARFGREVSVVGSLKGKLAYMSPEQARAKPVDHRSDIFSVGAILFELLLGRRVFHGETDIEMLHAVRRAEIQMPSSIDPTIHSQLERILLRALAPDPGDRYQTAEQLANALRTYRHEHGSRQISPREISTLLTRMCGAPRPAANGKKAPDKHVGQLVKIRTMDVSLAEGEDEDDGDRLDPVPLFSDDTTEPGRPAEELLEQLKAADERYGAGADLDDFLERAARGGYDPLDGVRTDPSVSASEQLALLRVVSGLAVGPVFTSVASPGETTAKNKPTSGIHQRPTAENPAVKAKTTVGASSMETTSETDQQTLVENLEATRVQPPTIVDGLNDHAPTAVVDDQAVPTQVRADDLSTTSVQSPSLEDSLNDATSVRMIDDLNDLESTSVRDPGGGLRMQATSTSLPFAVEDDDDDAMTAVANIESIDADLMDVATMMYDKADAPARPPRPAPPTGLPPRPAPTTPKPMAAPVMSAPARRAPAITGPSPIKTTDSNPSYRATSRTTPGLGGPTPGFGPTPLPEPTHSVALEDIGLSGMTPGPVTHPGLASDAAEAVRRADETDSNVSFSIITSAPVDSTDVDISDQDAPIVSDSQMFSLMEASSHSDLSDFGSSEGSSKGLWITIVLILFLGGGAALAYAMMSKKGSKDVPDESLVTNTTKPAANAKSVAKAEPKGKPTKRPEKILTNPAGVGHTSPAGMGPPEPKATAKDAGAADLKATAPVASTSPVKPAKPVKPPPKLATRPAVKPKPKQVRRRPRPKVVRRPKPKAPAKKPVVAKPSGDNPYDAPDKPRKKPSAPGGKGFLVVKSTPWAFVYVDGKKTGTTSARPIPLSPGSHKVELVNPETQQRVKFSVKVAAGETKKLHKTLE